MFPVQTAPSCLTPVLVSSRCLWYCLCSVLAFFLSGSFFQVRIFAAPKGTWCYDNLKQHLSRLLGLLEGFGNKIQFWPLNGSALPLDRPEWCLASETYHPLFQRSASEHNSSSTVETVFPSPALWPSPIVPWGWKPPRRYRIACLWHFKYQRRGNSWLQARDLRTYS